MTQILRRKYIPYPFFSIKGSSTTAFIISPNGFPVKDTYTYGTKQFCGARRCCGRPALPKWNLVLRLLRKSSHFISEISFFAQPQNQILCRQSRPPAASPRKIDLRLLMEQSLSPTWKTYSPPANNKAGNE